MWCQYRFVFSLWQQNQEGRPNVVAHLIFKPIEMLESRSSALKTVAYHHPNVFNKVQSALQLLTYTDDTRLLPGVLQQ